MKVTAGELLAGAIANLKKIAPSFAPGESDANAEYCSMVLRIKAPELPESVAAHLIEFSPQDADSPREAVGNEFRKIVAVFNLALECKAYEVVSDLSRIRCDIQNALIDPNRAGFPRISRRDVADQDDPSLESAVVDFIDAFEAVFHYDWEYSAARLEGMAEYLRRPDAERITFLDMYVSEADDWFCCQHLLATYQSIVKVLSDRDMRPIVKHEKSEDWLYGKHELTTTWSVVADTTMSAPITSDLAERADRGDRKKFERALRKVKDRTPRPEDQA